MPEEPRHSDSLARPLADPEPLSMALAIVGALASVGALAAEIRGQIEDQRFREAEEKKKLRNAVGSAQRSLDACRVNLEDLANILHEHDQRGSRFALGAAPLVGEPDRVGEIRALHDRILGNARRMRDGFIQVSELLDDADHRIVNRYIREIDIRIRSSLESGHYSAFIRRASQVIAVTERLLGELAADHTVARYPEGW